LCEVGNTTTPQNQSPATAKKHQKTTTPNHHNTKPPKSPPIGNFKKLRVWQQSKNLAVRIYQITDEHPKFNKDFRFRDQIRAAAVSIPSNTAEGDELNTNKQSIRHFYIAKGSTAEVITQLIIAKEIGYLPPEITAELIKEYEHVSHMLAKLIGARSKTP